MAGPMLRTTKTSDRTGLGLWCRRLALPFLLLIAQQGVLLHELGHYRELGVAQARDDEHGQRHTPSHHCDLCVAFAQLASMAPTTAATPPLLDGLRFEEAFAGTATVAVAELPAQRSRGPPAAL